MTIRRWMAAIVLIAVACWGGVMVWRSCQFEQLARVHRQKADEAIGLASDALRQANHTRQAFDLPNQETAPIDNLRSIDVKHTDFYISINMTVDLGSNPSGDLERRGALALYRRQLEDFHNRLILLKRHENLAETYQEASRRPWSFRLPATSVEP